jgi:hypothetical protein
MFQKLDLCPSSGERGEKTPTQLGPLERANLNHWTTFARFTQLVSRILDDGKVKKKKKTVILQCHTFAARFLKGRRRKMIP